MFRRSLALVDLPHIIVTRFGRTVKKFESRSLHICQRPHLECSNPNALNGRQKCDNKQIGTQFHVPMLLLIVCICVLRRLKDKVCSETLIKCNIRRVYIVKVDGMQLAQIKLCSLNAKPKRKISDVIILYLKCGI